MTYYYTISNDHCVKCQELPSYKMLPTYQMLEISWHLPNL